MNAFFAYLFTLIWIMPFILFIAVPLLALFFSFLGVSISNLRNGIKDKWPKKNIVGLSICGSITMVCLAACVVLSVIYFHGVTPIYHGLSSSGSSTQTLATIKNIFIFY